MTMKDGSVQRKLLPGFRFKNESLSNREQGEKGESRRENREGDRGLGDPGGGKTLNREGHKGREVSWIPSWCERYAPHPVDRRSAPCQIWFTAETRRRTFV